MRTAMVVLLAAACAWPARVSWAGLIACTGKVKGVTVWARNTYEGVLAVDIESQFQGNLQTRSWYLCSLNEGRTHAKSGSLLTGIHDTSAEVCEAALTNLLFARATGVDVEIHFLNSASGADPVFDSCDTVPVWSGTSGVAGEDDPGERLGAWDGFYGVSVK